MRLPLLTFLLCLLGVFNGAQARETLRVLAWPGYADADLVKVFETRHRVRVEVTIVDSDDVLWQKMSAGQGRDFDVFAVNTAELRRYMEQGLTAPINLAGIPNTQRQLPRFRDLAAIPGIYKGGRPHAVPYTYSAMGLIYNRKLVSEPPTSINVLWDPRYRGQVLAFDASSHNFSLAAMSLGLSPFQLRSQDWKPVLERLIALRRNVLTFYNQPEEAVELFKTHPVALVFANYGSQQVRQLQDKGADIGYVIPREGALAWLDCWAISAGAVNKTLAEQWINYTLEPEVSGALTRRQGLANTIQASEAGGGDKVIWLEPVEDVDRRARLWSRIRSGDRLEQF